MGPRSSRTCTIVTTMSAESGGNRIFGPRSLLTVAATLAFALGMLVHFGLSGSTRGLAIMVGVALLTLSAFLASIWRAARGGPEATGWKLLSTSLGIAVVTQAARVLTAMGVPLPDAFNGASLFLPFLGTCLQIGALFFWNLAPRNHFDRIRHGLDGLLFALAVFFILWALVLGPVFLSDHFPLVSRLTW